MGKGNIMGGEGLTQLLKQQLIRGKFSGAIAVLACGMMLIIIGHFYENIDKDPIAAIQAGSLFVGAYIIIKAFEILSGGQSIITLAIKKHFNLGEPLQNASQESIAKGIDAVGSLGPIKALGSIKEDQTIKEIKEEQKSIAKALADLEKEKEKLIAEAKK